MIRHTAFRFPPKEINVRLYFVSTEKHDLLVVAPERWDEACFAIPAVRALIASGLGVGVSCSESQSSLWRTIDQLKVLPHLDNASAGTIAKSIDDPWEAALLLEYSPAAIAAKKCKITRRLGAPIDKLSKLLTHPLDIKIGPLDHRVRYYLSLADAMGVKTLDPSFFQAAPQAERVSQSILLCPDSDQGAHYEWSLDYWKKIAKSLVGQNTTIGIACRGQGRKMGEALSDLLPSSTKVDIADLSSALPTLSTYSLVIAADGSLPHLAAHAGATCVTLFGPNDPNWKRPLGKHHGIAKHHVECAPCLLNKCPLDLRCQHELKVDEVMAVIFQTQASA